MSKHKMNTLSTAESKTKGILVKEDHSPYISGNGPDDYVCGNCGNVIAKSVTRNDLARMVNAAFKCYQCKKVNAL